MATRPGALAGARIVGERFARSRRRQNPEGRMPLIDHLRELRNRVVKMAFALAAGMTAGFIFFGRSSSANTRSDDAMALCSRLNFSERSCNGWKKRRVSWMKAASKSAAHN